MRYARAAADQSEGVTREAEPATRLQRLETMPQTAADTAKLAALKIVLGSGWRLMMPSAHRRLVAATSAANAGPKRTAAA